MRSHARQELTGGRDLTHCCSVKSCFRSGPMAIASQKLASVSHCVFVGSVLVLGAAISRANSLSIHRRATQGRAMPVRVCFFSSCRILPVLALTLRALVLNSISPVWRHGQTKKSGKRANIFHYHHVWDGYFKSTWARARQLFGNIMVEPKSSIKYVTVLRDPVEHWLSYYYFYYHPENHVSDFSSVRASSVAWALLYTPIVPSVCSTSM